MASNRLCLLACEHKHEASARHSLSLGMLYHDTQSRGRAVSTDRQCQVQELED